MIIQGQVGPTSTNVSVGPGTAFRWLNWVGHQLIDNIELEIGRFDR